VVWVHTFVAALYSHVSLSFCRSETPPNRTIVPFDLSNDIPEYARADGCDAGFLFVQLFADGLYTQVSAWFRPL